MRILMVNKFLYRNGGSETYMLELGQYLSEIGNEVQYFGMEHKDKCVGNAVGAYTSEMDFHTGSFFSKILYPIKTIYSNEARRKIRKVLENFEPELVHLNNFNYQLTPSIILEIVKWRKEKKNNCRIVYTAHDYQLVCPNHMMRNPRLQSNCEKCIGGHYTNCLKYGCIHNSKLKSVIGMMEACYWNFIGTYNYIDYIICPSEFVKNKLDTNKIFKNKTITIHNFINIPRFQKINCSQKYILYYGRLSEEKGIKTLLEVCRALPDIKFVFAGGGPLIRELKDYHNVEYVGFKNGEELWNLVSNAYLCVCPSVCNEVFGLSICEAISLGTPVLASEIGGIPEAIGSGGLLVTPGDVGELKSVIERLWNNPKEVENIITEKALDEILTVQTYSEILMEKVYKE